jgi:hypothetical protein
MKPKDLVDRSVNALQALVPENVHEDLSNSERSSFDYEVEQIVTEKQGYRPVVNSNEAEFEISI